MRDPDEDGDSEGEPPGSGGDRRLKRREVPDSDTLLDYEPLRDRRRPASRDAAPSADPATDGVGGQGPANGTADDAGAPGDGPDRAGTADQDLEVDRLFDVLADEHRRVALHYLRDRGGAAPFEDVVDVVADRADSGEHPDRRAVQSALYHVHLPKLKDVGLLAESDPDGEVRLSSRVAGLPWSLLDAR